MPRAQLKRGMAPDRRSPAGGRRERILEAAVEQFSTRSYDSVQAAAIAQSAGVASGLPFHYFGSKRGLYLEALRVAAGRFAPAPPELEGSLQVRISHHLDGHLKVVADNEALFLGLMRGGMAGDPEVREIHEQLRHGGIALLLGVLGIDESLLTPRLRIVIRGWIGFVDEASLDWLNGGELERGELAELLAEVLVGALRAIAGEHPAIARAVG